MNNLSESMLRVDSIFHLPHMCVNYDSAFSDFRKFQKNNDSQAFSSVYISLQRLHKATTPYIFGLMENVSANPDVSWYVKDYPESAGDLHNMSRLLLTLDNVSVVPEGLSPYVQGDPVRLNHG